MLCYRMCNKYENKWKTKPGKNQWVSAPGYKNLIFEVSVGDNYISGS